MSDIEELAAELTDKFIHLNMDCECKKAKLGVEIVDQQLKEACYKAETARFAMDAAKFLSKGQERMFNQAANIIRPSTSMPVQVTFEMDEWHCKLGDVDAIGVTPETACQEFDRQWLGKDSIE